MITARAAMMIRVNNHKQQFDGTICSNATAWACGANPSFRQNKCARGLDHCYEIYLFDRNDPHLRKPIDADQDGYVSDMEQALDQGDSPLLFLYSGSALNPHMLVGLYVVGDLAENAMSAFSRELVFRPQPGFALFFDDPSLTNESLYRHSIGTNSFYRSVAENFVPTALNEILQKQQLLLEECSRSGQQGRPDRLTANVAALEAIIRELGHAPAGDAAPAERPASTSQNAGGAVSLSARATLVKAESAALATAPAPVKAHVDPAQKKRLDDLLTAVRAQTRAQGLFYTDELIKRYHLSLITKPFVIFAGVSGGGKTQLAMAYAQAIGARLAVISVGPNWTGGEALLGTYDALNGRFAPTEFTSFLAQAEAEYQQALQEGREATPYCVVLDEMNLSHVEYYFSEFLSKMELPEGHREVILHPYEAQPNRVTIPPNLLITGTVNVDETTYRFSPKVLDRANFIRLDEINLMEMVGLIDAWRPTIQNREQAREVAGYLRSINTILMTSQQHFGYRTAREVITWVDRATASGAFTMAEALDLQLLQKVLVKVQGSRFNPTERAMIEKLTIFFNDTTDPETQQPLFPHSTAQMERMQRALNEAEFTFGQQ